MIPIAKMEKFCNAPPPNVSSKPKTEACSVMKSIASLLEYGRGINVPRRETTNMSNVNMIFRLISPTRIELESVRNIKRSEEHTSELQSRGHIVCRPRLEKK